MSWTHKNTLEFLELYKKEPCIWNPRHKMHKNKHATSDAWSRIQKAFNVPYTIEELKKKKESLMTTFRYHLNKRRASIRSNAIADEVYSTNWFAYKTMESFLTPIYQRKETIDIQLPETETTFRAGVEDPSDDSTNPSTSSSRHLSSSLRQKQLREIIAIKRKMDEIFSMFQTVIEASRKKQEPHECDLYGQLLAKRLKRFDENVRDSIMHQIDNIMYQAKQKHNNPVTRSP